MRASGVDRNITRQQLEWVSRNRRERSRGETLSAVAARLVERAGERHGAESGPRAAAAVAEVTDELFRRHCRVKTLARGLLTVEVDDPRLVGYMRMCWGEPIRERLSKTSSVGRVRAVRFVGAVAPPWGRGGGGREASPRGGMDRS
ncbi:MAG: hypothetical protein HOP29_00700 [Phycisphaerales bacterium]|nr:hypothetical protein [Phycisphaerales bacterium]